MVDRARGFPNSAFKASQRGSTRPIAIIPKAVILGRKKYSPPRSSTKSGRLLQTKGGFVRLASPARQTCHDLRDCPSAYLCHCQDGHRCRIESIAAARIQTGERGSHSAP